MKKEPNLNHFDLFKYLKDRYKSDKQPAFFMADEKTYDEILINFPIRNFAYGVGLTYAGETGSVLIGSREYKTGPGSLITIGPGIVSQWQPNILQKHTTIFFSEEVFRKNIQYSFLNKIPFFLPGGNHVIQLNEQQTAEMKALLDMAKIFVSNQDIFSGLLYSALMLAEKSHLTPETDGILNSHNERITNLFHSLLIQNFLTKKEVNFYATHMNVSAKHLSEILVSTTGKTAKQLINDIIFLEARSLLRQTDMSIQEICYWLGFEDTSYFTKAFKKVEGITPNQYRKL